MIRLLIVDDSPTMRLLVRSIVESDPEIQVVGEAMDGEQALALAHQLTPDIITMDLQMPKVSGIEAIQRIMAETPRPIIVLTSHQSEVELKSGFQALQVGALAVLAKPKDRPGKNLEMDTLILQIKAMSQVKVIRRQSSANYHNRSHIASPVVKQKSKSFNKIALIAIGASTGGPPALQVLLQTLSLDLNVPILIVQHISPGFVMGLVRWLDETTPWQVMLAQDRQNLQPGSVYIAPDNCHLSLKHANQIWLDTQPPLEGHRPSVSILFETAATVYGKNALGILLTGMGSDGASGLKTLRDSGALTIVQDETSSLIFGMPKQAILLGAAQEVLPLDEIGPFINALAGLSDT